ncbi:MAG TPA: alpha/beta fold hydrolase, partial [Longimicrobium sp.]|nr:alpha/beta fold hydrolase [Longimicrobium sp.]
MNDSAPSSPQNSTNGRAVPLALRLLRGWFRVASAVAPRTAERQAASLFLTPPRRRQPDAGLEDAAAGRYAFTVHDGEREVAAWSWGSGPVVLLAHGWGGSAADMAPLAERLQRAGYRAVLVDFPAHGRSPGRRTNMVEWLGALRAVAAAVGPIHAAAGHSFGGAAIALSMSELELDVRGAVLIAPAAGPVLFLDRFTRMIG